MDGLRMTSVEGDLRNQVAAQSALAHKVGGLAQEVAYQKTVVEGLRQETTRRT